MEQSQKSRGTRSYQTSLRILKIERETIVDGVGLRMSLYFSGCSHFCDGCHNQLSWDANQGRLVDDDYFDEIIHIYKQNPLLSGMTLTGGDPFYDAKALLIFLNKIKMVLPTIHLWAYTGFTLEEIRQDVVKSKCLDYLDVLVDGRFVQSLQDPYLQFRGSSNQKIIDLKQLNKNKA